MAWEIKTLNHNTQRWHHDRMPEHLAFILTSTEGTILPEEEELVTEIVSESLHECKMEGWTKRLTSISNRLIGADGIINEMHREIDRIAGEMKK